MAKFTKWIRKALESLIDPEREARVEALSKLIHRGLHKDRHHFQLSAAVHNLDYSDMDVDLAKNRVLRKILERAWKDGKLDEKEKQTIAWVANSLDVSPEQLAEANLASAKEQFAAALAQAMEDGVLDAAEERQLHEIAASVGSAAPAFARSFFRKEGESFLRGIFLACVADKRLSHDDWTCLLATMSKLGIRRDELLESIQPHAKRLVEHVLADAKSDGALSSDEEATLRWLMVNLDLPDDHREYVEHELRTLKTLTEIGNGKLPTVQAPLGVETRAGEIVHFRAPAVWKSTRRLKSGPRAESHHGIIALTDNRIIFSSETKSRSLRYVRVVSHRGNDNGIEVQVEGKPASAFVLEQSLPFAYAIFRSALAMANQTKIRTTVGSPSRHIPRDVRQRVWQRYGGKCAECNADDYLEFDHIVPVARGGSNSDKNIQLLCRRCNLKKSDHI